MEIDEKDKNDRKVIFSLQMKALPARVEKGISAYGGTLAEDFQHKLNPFVEGHQKRCDKGDWLDGRMEKLEGRADGIENKVDAATLTRKKKILNTHA